MRLNCLLDIHTQTWDTKDMKSSRAGALAQRSFAKPGKVNLGPEAASILKNLERARNYGSKRKYNAELNKLAKNHPEFAETILTFVWK
jgi:hypothetical protein